MMIGGKYMGGGDLEKGSPAEGHPGKQKDPSYRDDSNADSSMSAYNEMGDESSMSDLRSRAAKETRNNLAKNETRFVSCLRYFVLIVLMGTAIGVSLATYFYSRSVETDAFTAEFDSVAITTLRSFVEAVEHSFGSLDAVSTSITSHALRTGETFPNVTIPDFEVKGSTARTQTGSIFMFYLVKVEEEERRGYEEYTRIQQQQLFGSYVQEEGMRIFQDAYFGINASETEAAIAREQAAAQAEADAQAVAAEEHGEDHEHNRKQRNLALKYIHDMETMEEQRKLHVAPPDPENPMPPFGHMFIHDRIWGLNEPCNLTEIECWYEPENTGPYLPMWQLSPTIPLPALVNFNFFDYTDISPAIKTALDTGHAALTYLQTTHLGSDTEQLIQVFLTLNQYRHKVVDYNADPMTQISYPVFDSFNPLEKKTVGVLQSAIFWRLLLLDILPENVKGVICVLKTSLGEVVTYQVDGRDAIYLGEGDLHEEKYDDMGVSRDISEYMAERANVESSSYTTIELDSTYIQYEIFVYPSQTMEDTYISSDPILYAVVVAFIFVFTSMVFIVYDWCVEKRQKKVLGVAVRSTAVVTSLFPTAVHERLFGDKEEEASDRQQDPWLAQNQGPDGSMGALPTVGDADDNTQNGSSGHLSFRDGLTDPNKKKKKKKGGVIADKYAATTIFFADLAGFTKWSSTREPEQVFELLEALYGAFDKIALRRVVFKVETIGDCYMAVTGIPNQQPDHAIRMVKFARDCMLRMDRLLQELQHTLGSDTVELAMRVGLHSGPVTAGVLRGDKGRFQLFGDTVNTASRMESNGVKRRIHVSQSTADLLPAKWLTKREDKIVAKGKGEMQTYFVEAASITKSTASGFTAFASDDEEFSTLNTGLAPPSTDRFSNEADSISDLGVGEDVKDLNMNVSFKDDSSNRAEETFRNEPSTSREETAPILPAKRFSRFGDSIAKALKLADEISV